MASSSPLQPPKITTPISPPIPEQPAVAPTQVGTTSNGRTVSIGTPSKSLGTRIKEAVAFFFLSILLKLESKAAPRQPKVKVNPPKTKTDEKAISTVQENLNPPTKVEKNKHAAQPKINPQLNEFVKQTTNLTSDTIEDFLNNPFGLKAITLFCDKRFQSENIEFLLELDKYKKNPKEHFQSIKEKYINAGGASQVNLPSHIVNKIKSINQVDPPKDAFDSAEKEIRNLIYTSINENAPSTQIFQECCLKVLQQQGQKIENP